MKNPIRLCCSPLTGTIYAGRISKDGQTWAGEKHDVTDDAIGAIINKIGDNAAMKVTIDEVPAYEITVRKL